MFIPELDTWIVCFVSYVSLCFWFARYRTVSLDHKVLGSMCVVILRYSRVSYCVTTQGLFLLLLPSARSLSPGASFFTQFMPMP